MFLLKREAVLWVGFALIILSLFLPIHGCRADPKDFEPPPAGEALQGFSWDINNPVLVPVRSIPEDIARGGVWAARHWYPYLLVPIWLLLFLGVARGDAARRRRLGVLAIVLSAFIALFEIAYLWRDLGTGWNRFGPPWMRPILVLGVWMVVLYVLNYRRPGRRRIEDVEATVSSQALLSALHAFSFPVWEVVCPVLKGRDPWPVFAAASCNYRYGLWVAAIGFLLVARPGYSNENIGDECSDRGQA